MCQANLTYITIKTHFGGGSPTTPLNNKGNFPQALGEKQKHSRPSIFFCSLLGRNNPIDLKHSHFYKWNIHLSF